MKTPRLLVALLAASSAFATEPAWRSLFNGRDLTGWKIAGAAPKA